jgi:hypothetical protein
MVMKGKPRKLLSLDNVSVVHLNATSGYITYVEVTETGKSKVKGIVLDVGEEKKGETEA